MIDDKINKYKIIKIRNDKPVDSNNFTVLDGVSKVDLTDIYNISLKVEREKVNSVAAKILESGWASDINISEYPIELQIENIFLNKD